MVAVVVDVVIVEIKLLFLLVRHLTMKVSMQQKELLLFRRDPRVLVQIPCSTRVMLSHLLLVLITLQNNYQVQLNQLFCFLEEFIYFVYNIKGFPTILAIDEQGETQTFDGPNMHLLLQVLSATIE
jgi:hypothetical protein